MNETRGPRANLPPPPFLSRTSLPGSSRVVRGQDDRNPLLHGPGVGAGCDSLLRFILLSRFILSAGADIVTSVRWSFTCLSTNSPGTVPRGASRLLVQSRELLGEEGVARQ
jgi:hypothetical protein